EGWIGKKKKKNTQEVEALVLGGLWDALRTMIDCYDTQFEAYNTALQISQTIYSYGVLNRLQDQLTEYRRQNAQLLISDTNRLITDIIHEQFDAPFIYEKVGTRFRHYLLDEFQDTSQMQWTNILPLLREALAYGQQSLLVGDVKQSIYRWRNGDWKLLLQKVEDDIRQSNMPPRLEFLDTNYRTVEEIVHFNNVFFQEASKLLSIGLQDISEEKQDIFHMAYDKVAQQARYKREAHPGWVSVEFFKQPSLKEQAELPSWQEQALDRLLETLQDLPAQGYRLGDVCLLVRTNKDGIKIAEFLQKHDISVVSAESLLLISDPKVRFLLSLLSYINQEDDPIAAAALRYYYYQIHEGQQPDHGVFTSTSHLEDKVVSPETREKLRQKSVYECVEQAIALFPDLQTPNAYLTGFLNAVLEFTASVDASIGGFLEWWADEQHKRSIHATPNPHAVQIMT
ncbi:MAG: UvrD-helicase domain-containing protein, partial [Bacteroidota bacterium]